MFKLSSLLALVLALCVWPLMVHAEPQPDLRRLSKQTTWLKLGHYQARGGGFESDVETPNFFLAPNGRIDPESELSATVAAMVSPPADDADAHAQCRFPARYLWLKRVMGPDWRPRDLDCPKYDKWRGESDISSISLVFVSGRLTNPATYYGHILLKFNAPENATAEGLLDTSLNYGAVFPPNENGVVYLAKGVAGGYRSSFTNLTFYNHSHRYGETELRNLWEYELSLDAWQVRLVVAHAWELMGKENRYFFLKQNCAYRMAELVNIVAETPLLPSNKAWAAPVDVFTRLMAARQGDAPLVARVHSMPSRQARFHDKLDRLTPAARALLETFIGAPAEERWSLLGTLPEPDRAAVLEALIDYYDFVEIKDEAASAAAVQTKDRLLLMRLALPASTTPAPPPSGAPPHLGQRSSMIQASVVSNSSLGQALELRFRGAHHDFLTYAPGVPANSELTLADVSIAIRDDSVSLQALEIARITNLNISETGLPGDGGRAWRLRLGVERVSIGCDRCLEGYVEGGLGKAAQIGGGLAVYGFLNGRLALGDGDAVARVGPSAGILFGPKAKWRANLEARAWQNIDGDQDFRPGALFALRIGASPRWDFRTAIQYEHARGADITEARAGFAGFW